MTGRYATEREVNAILTLNKKPGLGHLIHEFPAGKCPECGGRLLGTDPPDEIPAFDPTTHKPTVETWTYKRCPACGYGQAQKWTRDD